MTGDRNSRSARSGHGNADISKLLADELQRIDQCRRYYDCRAVLVVVEYRNVAKLDKSLFDLKAAGSGNVLKIYPAEAAGQQIDSADYLVNVL